MQKQIAFLRAINVGGHTVKMERLRELFEELGLARVETFIASGNVIFDAPDRRPRLASEIETHLEGALGYSVATFIRTDADVAAIARRAPVLPGFQTVNVALLAEPLTKAARQALGGLRTGIDDFHVQEREVYWLCRARQSESAFSNALFERTLKIKSTFRSLSTIAKLAAKYPPS
ncbi:MAG: DUF1697 domain-containing protein [Bryobacterales bacterium]|nr:DUF1697 domain-containing protein [Bryobacterales bacterium]